jgi:hypothetical protein
VIGMSRLAFLPGRLPLLFVVSLAAATTLAAHPQGSAGGKPMPHLVSILSGDVVAEPQVLYGTVSAGKAELSGTFKAIYDFDKWIANTNQGDPSAYEVLKRAQVAAGGALTGQALFKVDANAAVNSFITVVVDVGGESHTIKMYTCVDHRKTTVTENESEIVVSQVEGTACAYKAPLVAFSNEGENLVYRIRK